MRQLAIDATDGGCDPALEQRPIEADDERAVASRDHGVSQISGRRNTAKYDPAIQNRRFEQRYHCLNLRQIGLTSKSNARLEITRTDEQEIEFGS